MSLAVFCLARSDLRENPVEAWTAGTRISLLEGLVCLVTVQDDNGGIGTASFTITLV